MSHLQGMGSFKSSKNKKAGGGKGKGGAKTWGKGGAKKGAAKQEDDEDKINRTDEEVALITPREVGKMHWVSDPHTVWTIHLLIITTGEKSACPEGFINYFVASCKRLVSKQA